jgi:hypothetical protein
VNILVHACRELEDRIHQADQKCHDILKELSRFEDHVYSEPLDWIKLRLQFITLQIMNLTVSLYKEHGEKGFVFVVLTKTALGVYWDKNKKFFRSRSSLNDGDMQIMSIEEGMAILTKLKNKVESGNFSEVIQWINQHAICIV